MLVITKQVNKNLFVTLLDDKVLPTLLMHKKDPNPAKLSSTSSKTISTVFNPKPEQLAMFNKLHSELKYQFAVQRSPEMLKSNNEDAVSIFVSF